MKVHLKGGRRGSFEVTLDGEVIHSKLDTGDWPDEAKVVAAVAGRLAR